VTLRVLTLLAIAALALALSAAGGVAAVSRSGSPTTHGWFNEVPIDDPAFADLRDWLIAMGASQLAVEQAAAIAQVPDPASIEYINPAGGTGPTEQADYVVPRLTLTVELKIPNIEALAAPGGPLAAGAGPVGEVFYGRGLTAPTGESWYLYSKVFTAPCEPSGIREYGIVGYDTTPLNGGNPDRYASDPSNLFYDNNFAYVVHSDPQTPFIANRYEYGAPGKASFNLTDSGWMGICFNDTVIGLIPEAEWSGTTDIRFFAYDLPFRNGQAQANDASQMRLPGVQEDPLAVDGLAEIDLAPTAATSEPTPTSTSEPTETATSEPTETATSEPTAAATTEPTANSTAGSTPASTEHASSQPQPTGLPAATPSPGPGPGESTSGGLDPFLLLALAGSGLIGIAAALFYVSIRREG